VPEGDTHVSTIIFTNVRVELSHSVFRASTQGLFCTIITLSIYVKNPTMAPKHFISILFPNLLLFSAIIISFPVFGINMVYVLDKDNPSIVKISPSSGKVIGTVKLEKKPDRIIISPDGKRLITLEKGRGSISEVHGFVPKRQSFLSIIDTKTMEIISSRKKICWDISTGIILNGIGVGGNLQFSEDSQHIGIYCNGKWFTNPSGVKYKPLKKPVYPEILRINLDTGMVDERLLIDQHVNGWVSEPNGRNAIVFLSYQKKYRGIPEKFAELRFINTQTFQTEHRIPIEGDPDSLFISSDKAWLYLIDSGRPTIGQKSHINGRVHIFSIINRSYEGSIEVGSKPKGFVDFQNNQFVVVSKLGPNKEKKKQKTGIAHVISADRLISQFEIGKSPIYIKNYPREDRFYAIGKRSLSVVEISSSNLTEIVYKPRYKYLGDIAITKEHDYAFLLASDRPGSFPNLFVFDLNNLTVTNPLKIGRTDVRFAKNLASGVAVAAVSFAIGDIITLGPSSSLNDLFYSAILDASVKSMVAEIVMLAVTSSARNKMVFSKDNMNPLRNSFIFHVGK